MKPFHFSTVNQVLFICLMCICCLGGSGYAQTEKILNYDIQIEVHTDRSITVTEYIEVNVTGDQIKRGITRNLPTRRNLNEESVKMKYQIIEVKKNGATEPYRKTSEQGLMLYLGQKDVLLDPGVYQYKIKYRVADQIGFFDDYDEIYWNAIGNDVKFDIEQASCRIQLPAEAEIMQESAYTGAYGQKEKAYSLSRERSVLDYRTTRGLRPGEGFTVAVGINKDIISAPNMWNRLGTLILIILGSTFLLPYYLFTWWKHGQDPPMPASYPIWNAPDDLSAASINYIQQGKHESKSFTASIIHLAIQGYLKIEETVKKGFLTKSRHYQLIKLKDPEDDIPAEEKNLLVVLFGVDSQVSITGKYDELIEEAYASHQASLSLQHRPFIRKGHNSKLLIPPILVSLAIGVIALILWFNSPYATSANLTSLIAFAPIAIGSLALYGYLIKKPSKEKLDLRSRIKGFQMYLELAESDRLRLLNPPDMTPEHFEKLLPYAFALGVEHQWTERFKTILEKAQYQPHWHNSTSPIYFSNHFGRDFSRGVAGAATKPSDTGSGSGGGGFSGGGGGGGGVGGW